MTPDHRNQKRQVLANVPGLSDLYKTLVPIAMSKQKFWMSFFLLTAGYADYDEDILPTLEGST